MAFTTALTDHHAPELELLPRHLDIRVELDIPTARARLTERLRLGALRAGAATLRLDLVGAAEVEVEGARARYDGHRLDLELPAPFARGEEVEVLVRYLVQRPLTGLHFGPDWAATDHETERARYWLACVDHPSVRPTVALTLVLPAGQAARGPGALVGVEALADGRQAWRWELNHPCPSYLLCFVAGALVEADGGEHQGRPIRFYAPAPWTEADLRRSFGPTAALIDWMTGFLGRPLPWPRYEQFAVPGIGGAMENISLVSWDDGFLCDERLHEEQGWIVDLINLHELAHTWFGDDLVCQDFSHSWLKESWATYMESVWIEQTQGVEARQAWLSVGLRNYLDEARSRYRRPIATRRFDSSWDLFDRHLYPGGAVRLHLLRTELGEEDFWGGVRAYLARHSGGLVETDDLRRALEEASGRSLSRFFEQWFRRPGHPKLQLALRDLPHATQLRVRQVQVDAAAGVGLFEFPLELAFLDAAGAWRRQRLMVSEEQHGVDLPAGIRALVVDPEAALPHELVDWDPGDDRLIAALEGPFLRGRLQAVQAACALGRPALFTALGRAIHGTESWLERRLQAALLGESPFAAAAGLLAERILAEASPRAMGALMLAAASHRDERLVAALVEWLGRPARPWIATQQALAALGAQRGDAQVERLAAYLGLESPGDRLRQGALAGLGATRSLRALPWIHPWLVEGRPPVRRAAVAALAEAVRWAERGPREQALEALLDRLRDEDLSVRKAAALALSALGEARAAAAIEAMALTVPVQDQAAMRRLAAGLRAGDPGSAALEKRIEALEARLRKLEEGCAGADRGAG